MPDTQVFTESGRACIARLRARIEEGIAPLLDGAPVALVDYPDHSNVGDSAIWLGETAFLRDHDLTPAYVSAMRSHDHDSLAAALPHGTILLHGGGNFGTLWQPHQDFRLGLLERFPDHRVIQLPQSLHFDDETSISQCARAIERHGRFVLCVRDAPSLEFARRHFYCDTRLVPDMAFAIGPLERGRPSTDIFRLLRTDLEKALEPGSVAEGPGTVTADWLEEGRFALRRAAITSAVVTLMDSPAAARVRRYERLARTRLGRGMKLLSTGRVVVTDRLHGHILSTLLDIPHVALDNNYRKIGNFIDAWTHSLDLLRVAASLDEAMTKATALLDGGARRSSI